MISRCSGYMPQFRKLEMPMPSMPDMITPSTPINPMQPMPLMPGTPYTPSTPMMPSAPAMPAAPAPSAPSTGTSPAINQPSAVRPSVPLTPGNTRMPEVIPNAPFFTVPPNPLLPPEYQEILSYENLQYLNGFLRTQIGKTCDVQFLIGSDSITTRTGMLIGVGINYILLQDIHTREVVACDFYSIKFIDFHM